MYIYTYIVIVSSHKQTVVSPPFSFPLFGSYIFPVPYWPSRDSLLSDFRDTRNCIALARPSQANMASDSSTTKAYHGSVKRYGNRLLDSFWHSCFALMELFYTFLFYQFTKSSVKKASTLPLQRLRQAVNRRLRVHHPRIKIHILHLQKTPPHHPPECLHNHYPKTTHKVHQFHHLETLRSLHLLR
jgi:hypothetical protein